MKRLLVLTALAACACERQEQQVGQVPTTPNEIGALQGPTSKPPAVVPMPKDQAELDRMILAGYTPHGSHLHAPGVKECPLAQGSDAVM